MVDFKDRFFTDKSLEDDGTWVDFGEGLKVKIRRSDCRLAKLSYRKLIKPYQKMIDAGNSIPTDDEEKIRATWTAQGMIADWEGVTDRKGKKVKFDPENLQTAIDLLVDARDFQKLINDYADEQETFRSQSAEEAAKNSPTSSGSTS